MAGLPKHFWLHDQCGCAKAPFVGARYRYWSKNLFTGEDRGWRYIRILDVEPMRHDRLLCRRATALDETSGTVFHPHLQDIFENHRYEAVDNVTSLRPNPPPSP